MKPWVRRCFIVVGVLLVIGFLLDPASALVGILYGLTGMILLGTCVILILGILLIFSI